MLCEIIASVFDKKGKLTTRPTQPIIKAIRKFSSMYKNKNTNRKKTIKTKVDINQNDLDENYIVNVEKTNKREAKLTKNKSCN